MVIKTMWIEQYLKKNEIENLEQQIAQIERSTEAEIVPVIVKSSSNYPQTRVTAMLLATVFMLLLWDLFGGYHFYWDHRWMAIGWVVFGLIFIFGLAPLGARVPLVQRWLTAREEEVEQCWKRARVEFYANRIYMTREQVGVLIFISLLERQVIVVPDQRIAETLPLETWQKMVDQMIAGIRQGQMAEGLRKGLEECSDLLKRHFPIKSGDKNELPNKIVVKE